MTDEIRMDRRMLEALVCPLTQTTLSYDAEAQELISRAARRRALSFENSLLTVSIPSASDVESNRRQLS